MQHSTPLIQKPVQKLSILMQGPPGGGKTTLAMQFPNVCFVDLDENLDGPERFIRLKNKELAYSYISATRVGGLITGEPIPIEQCFDALGLQLDALRKEASVKVVVLDGLTMLNEIVKAKVLKEQAKVLMEPHFWDSFKQKLCSIIVAKLRSLNKTTILICHETILEKPGTAANGLLNSIVTGYRPAVQSGITDYFGGYFTDMWRCTSEPIPGNKVKFTLQTMKDSMSDLKNSIGMPPKMEWEMGELGFGKIKPYLEGKL